MCKKILSMLEAIAGNDDKGVKASGLENISAEEALERVRVILNFVPGQRIRFFSEEGFEDAIFFRMEEECSRCQCITFDNEDGYFCQNLIPLTSIVLPGEGAEEYLAKIGKTSASSD